MTAAALKRNKVWGMRGSAYTGSVVRCDVVTSKDARALTAFIQHMEVYDVATNIRYHVQCNLHKRTWDTTVSPISSAV